MRKVGRNSLKYLKKWWNRTEGRGHKDFKNGGGRGGGGGGKLSQGVDALKKGAAEPPYKLCV